MNTEGTTTMDTVSAIRLETINALRAAYLSGNESAVMCGEQGDDWLAKGSDILGALWALNALEHSHGVYSHEWRDLDAAITAAGLATAVDRIQARSAEAKRLAGA